MNIGHHRLIVTAQIVTAQRITERMIDRSIINQSNTLATIIRRYYDYLYVPVSPININLDGLRLT
jgi:hypothetical protein